MAKNAQNWALHGIWKTGLWSSISN